ncbi:MAG: hypothetical protein ABSA75_10460 [Candidatus Bathyarchaeia archaeon]|jgi:hypothetical protein
MDKKTIYILVAVLIVIVVVAVGGVLWVYNGGSNAVNSKGGGNNQPVSVANATSLEFMANVTTQGSIVVTHACYGKNIGTSNLTVRIDILGGESGNWSYILDTGQEKSWNNTNSGAYASGNFTADWNFWGTSWTNFVTSLKSWSGTGDYSYTSSNGNPVTIYNIIVNPKLPDSLFQTS